jgi:tripartite-type tricarboxylate transporter receptor subunit TctC
MNMKRAPHIACTCLCIGALAAPALVAAADPPDYPVRPVRIIVSATPGGTVDLVARVLSPKLGERLGQSFVVDNRAGAGGIVSAELLIKSAPDGYTLGCIFTSFTTNAVLRKNPPYDPARDVTPITLVSWSPLALVANTGLGVESVRDLIALAKTRTLHYGSSGTGSGGHMSVELLKWMTGMNATHVPYKGAAAATNDVVAGHVQFEIVGPVTVVALARAGRLKLLAVTGAKRSPTLPDVPTVDESGVPGFDVVNWFGMVAPAKMTPALVNRLNREIAAALQLADVRQKLAGEGAEIIASSPAEFSAFLKRDVEKWRKVVAVAHIGAD